MAEQILISYKKMFNLHSKICRVEMIENAWIVDGWEIEILCFIIWFTIKVKENENCETHI